MTLIWNSQFCLAIECVAQNVKKESEPEFWLLNGRLIHHALRIDYCQRRGDVDWEDIDTDSLYSIAYLDNMMGRLAETEKMYMRALEGLAEVLRIPIRVDIAA